MISVEEAKQIILNQHLKRKSELIHFNDCLGRQLCEPVLADRAMPPFDRVTMDGIAIRFSDYERGVKLWTVVKTQYAGEASTIIEMPGECVEVMTGAVLPKGCDTIIRYEDLSELYNDHQEKQFQLLDIKIKHGQNIHFEGSDKKIGEVILSEGQVINATDIALLASVGKLSISVFKNPSIVVISTGDELTKIEDIPAPYQIRASNHYMIAAALKINGFECDQFLMRDDLNQLKELLLKCLPLYDLVIITGAVSKGKADFIPSILNELKVQKLFHGVAQRPAKPFWFGVKENCKVFAMPGNPVSAAVCTYIYLLPFLQKSLGVKKHKVKVEVEAEIIFKPNLNYFMQASIEQNEKGKLIAKPYLGNGSGDLTNLATINAFVELPHDQEKFEIGKLYDAYLTRNTIY
jgi:molybdopterin molybdotransferase